MHTAAVIFEGGGAAGDPLQQQIRQLRQAVTLDSLVKYQDAGLDQVVLATDQPDLAREALRLGARIRDTQEERPFHFGRVLQQVVRESGAGAVLYCSGAGLPLITRQQIQWILGKLAERPPCVVVNNVQSADLVAWNPASYIDRIEPPESDNRLGWLLQAAGMELILIPHSAAIHFDLDTPTDFLILHLSGGAGPRARAALAQLDWPLERLQAAADLLASDLPEVALLGRVGSSVVEYMNRNLRVRLRIFSEERGMKALGRLEAGTVTSLVGDLLEDVGPERFFRRLESICDAVFFDTRVVFANRGRRVSEWDRFCSDLGRVEAITDPWVRAFTEAAFSCRIPVVLGGHSVVAGGLWVLVDRAIAARGGTGGSFAPPGWLMVQ
ncbi:MAG TPA: hypothetical protein VIL07_09670 [Symbiobacteriaceae bacterium]